MAGDLILWTALLGIRALDGGFFVSLLIACGLAAFYFRSFGMMHEGVHSALATSRRWNNAVGSVYGIFCFLPFRSWQDVHLRHHQWTGNVEKDPSSRILLQFKRDGYRTSALVIWSWKNWVPVLAFMQHIVFWKATKSKSELFFVAMSVLSLGLSILALGPVAVTAGLLIYLYMVEIINFPHHLGMPQFEGDARFPATDQARFTRSCFYPKWFAHSVLLNFNLHTEHHLFPAHPWYSLDALHTEVDGAGLLLNRCEANEWILKNRAKPIETIMRQTFPPAIELAEPFHERKATRKVA